MSGSDEELNLACAERLIQVLLPLMRQLCVETEAAGGDGLTITQFRLLTALMQRPYTAGELAAYLGVAASTVSGLIGPLAKRGLVERGRDASDRRVVALRATEQGRACYRRMAVQVRDFLTGVFARLPHDTKQALLVGLDGLDGVISQPRTGDSAPTVRPNARPRAGRPTAAVGQ